MHTHARDRASSFTMPERPRAHDNGSLLTLDMEISDLWSRVDVPTYKIFRCADVFRGFTTHTFLSRTPGAVAIVIVMFRVKCIHKYAR